MHNYDYVLEHRTATQMQHVDALSRTYECMIVSETTFEQNLCYAQTKNPEINKLSEKLAVLPLYELRQGLVFRKYNNRLLFYVPKSMNRNMWVTTKLLN